VKLQKLGGYVSIVWVCVMIAREVVLAKAFRGLTGSGGSLDPVGMKAAFEASPIAFHMYYILGIVISIFALLVALSLQERMQANAPNLVRLAVIAASAYSVLTITTMIAGFLRYPMIAGTGDISAYRVFLILHSMLSAAATSVLGWGLLLFGWASLKTRALPRILSCLILVNGIADILRFAIGQFGLVDLLFLICIAWLGVVLLRNPEPTPAQT
jgi:hypothetical protein